MDGEILADNPCPICKGQCSKCGTNRLRVVSQVRLELMPCPTCTGYDPYPVVVERCCFICEFEMPRKEGHPDRCWKGYLIRDEFKMPCRNHPNKPKFQLKEEFKNG